MNLGLSWVNNIVLQSPLFFDSIFTAVTAALLGPAAGILTGLFTNLGMEWIYDFTGLYYPFAFCNMATGLIVGYAARQNWIKTTYQLILVIIATATANALLGGLIANIVFSGDTGVKIDVVISAFTELGQSLMTANFWARIPTNLLDKMITVYIAFFFLLLRKHLNETGAGPAA
ncbi:MAG: hypothetical protein PQJ58_14180 [Spirochaetales bacterium]|nr:hypothetical protein [Spirochaetales bacterium]